MFSQATYADTWDDAVAAIESGDDKTAIRLLKPLAEGGDARGQNSLGWMYEHGRGVQKDEREAVKWYRKADEQGYAKAQSNLGLAYVRGQGVTPDLEKAIQWYRKAAEQGYAEAQNQLGGLYLSKHLIDLQQGKSGSDELVTEALKWTRMAAEQGYPPAQESLAMILKGGLGVPPDLVQALVQTRFSLDRKRS